MFVSTLHFIILNNLFERESYKYFLVYMVKFITERLTAGKKKKTTTGIILNMFSRETNHHKYRNRR